MRARPFLLQWLLTLIILFATEAIFDLIVGDIETITSGRRIIWILIVSLALTAMFYKIEGCEEHVA